MIHRLTHERFSRRFLGFLTGACLILGLHVGSATAEEMETVEPLSFDELRDRYALPESQFVELDGINLHYVDEGEGPAVVLLHASYHSLRTWDALAARLRDNYRVVRLDMPGAGLSVDTKSPPAEKFSMMGRYVETVDNLAAHLGLESFSLVATSSGGAAGFRYASANPDRVERLVLINTAGMPRIPRNDPLRERASTQKYAGMKYRPREFWASSMAENFIGPNDPPDWLIDMAFDFARREGRAEQVANYRYSTGDPKTIMSGITSPTMIMWGKSNPTVMHLEADVIQHWMTGAYTTIRKYEGLGHYPYVEDLDAMYPDLSAFLAGDLDAELRKTVMRAP